ncbi:MULTISPECIES: beta-glucosidase BglX [Pseudomonas]|uniref:Periplasmic beta-glucosidase n=1 Tax=Pseudomonas brassicacearum (strain NFM421) TaxID=994484 RepID=F2KDZ5_PSEBN|nr:MULTISPECIES: beta-glucosidase BglX [Pseudomonas]EIK70671.1 periplasmic beta-glucosidase [Pseudomonas fluorescens Q8r1-96]AEA67472.1 Beta-glucosidase; Glycoside Hydrolase, GH3 family [Pseudomonas brassicacearum subsp. brassicacearum NFM421]AOS39000.1 beta-glucosidase [Pseudomonas brassicacearum]KAB0517728.1 beta-glucosidase BglX [Pseudomonas brassicacearum subsp. brassicacearum]NJP64497.1 beta-glucosidase BglX [Pseudomonas brassicacearum]
MKKLCLLGLFVSLASHPVFADNLPAPIENKDAFISNLMKQMTLEEKIGQLRLISIGPEMPREMIRKEIAAGNIGGTFNSITRDENRPMQDAAMRSRLKIPMFFAYDVIHGHRTIFPIPLALASSWDMDAIYHSGRIAAKEAAADSLDITFAPMVDISRDPRWGRTSEGFGEDTYLVSRIAGVMVKAFQGNGANAADSIMASVKHFALYGAVEGGRDYNTVDMSPLKMYQDYLPPYRAAIDAGAGGVMVALNSINGVPATANTWLMNDLLRKEWGFKGLAVSDHGAIFELIKHGVAKDGREAAKLAIKAGIDMSMNDSLYGKELPGLLKAGEIEQSDIDNAVREVLAAKYDMGLFKDPYLRIGKAEDDPADTYAESRLHRSDARDVARRSLVLLENRNQTLPLKKTAKIALVGPLAKAPIDMMGSWAAAGRPAQSVTLFDGMTRALGADSKLIYARGANITGDKKVLDYLNFLNFDAPEVVDDPRPAQVLIDEAVKAAKDADVVVAAVGESRGMSHESSSRTDLNIPASQRELIKALKATGKPLVLVLMNGRPLALLDEKQQADAILETWFSGTEGGNAIADVLFGDYNPSGKLPITFPRSVGQIPTYYNHLSIGRPFTPGKPGNYTSQYFDDTTGPLYPFGYGLSYTEFSLSDMALSSTTLNKTGKLDASVTLENTGKRDGETVVQLYIQDVTGSIIRPVKELKNFRKVMLKAGEKKVIHFTITEDDLKFFNAQLKYAAEPGKFNVQIGLDSQDVKQQSFELL